jgi:peptide/nickel transport system ATP-binding protein
MAGSGTVQLRDDPRVLLTVRNLVVEFPLGGGRKVHAVSDVSFDVLSGETLGLVGESGCGKTTTGLAIARLTDATNGSIALDGMELTALKERELRPLRPRFQMIFQDPLSSLNPRRSVRDIVCEPLRTWDPQNRDSWDAQAGTMLQAVGLDADVVGDRRPHELSGGQSQRVCIARALMLRPMLVICDEPVSSLDVSVQATILNLLEDLKSHYSLTLVFIAHDLAVVKNISDRVAVMYLGKLCEIGPAEEIYKQPAHPYTNALLESVPDIDKAGHVAAPPVRDEVPSPVNPPSGCRFRKGCPRATEVCAAQEPPMRRAGRDHFAACHHPLAPLHAGD